MAVALARVDDRLIHGQVVVGWVRETKANCIMVVNDAVAADPLQRSLLPLAVPPEIRVRVARVAEAPALLDGEAAAENVIVLFSNPVDAAAFVKAGGRMDSLNVGGMRFGPGKIQVARAISLGREDILALKAMKERGLPISVRMVPEDRPEDVFKLIEEAGG